MYKITCVFDVNIYTIITAACQKMKEIFVGGANFNKFKTIIVCLSLKMEC